MQCPASSPLLVSSCRELTVLNLGCSWGGAGIKRFHSVHDAEALRDLLAILKTILLLAVLAGIDVRPDTRPHQCVPGRSNHGGRVDLGTLPAVLDCLSNWPHWPQVCVDSHLPPCGLCPDVAFFLHGRLEVG